MLRSSSSRSLEDVQEEETVSTAPSTHQRSYSRIHQRNLSEFFPRPGQTGKGYGGTFDDPHSSSPVKGGVVDISGSSPSTPPPSSSKAQNRRGHHHRHSVSHNLFPFLDPSSPASHSSPIKPPSFQPSSPSPSDNATTSEQLPTPYSSFKRRYGSFPFIFQLPLYALLRLPFLSQAAICVAFAQLALGSSLWIQGQSGESLSVTGLGYLVVFDGLGALSAVVLQKNGGLERWKADMGNVNSNMAIQRPYGSVRLPTLSHFSQAIYLLFSAVYVCKESIEHVLLLHGPEEGEGGGHGSGHGGVGHGEGRVGGSSHTAFEPIHFPLAVLLASAVLAVLSALFFKTHSDLSNSIQPSPTQRVSSSSPEAKGVERPFSEIKKVLNPFTLTVAGFGIGLFAAATVLPPAQLSPLDKILSLLISLSMFYIAYPAALSTGKILLQTAPMTEGREARGVRQALEDIENHPSVVSIQSPHVWQLVPATLPTDMTSGPSTIVTLTLILKADTDEKDMLEMSRWAEERCRSAGIGAGGGKGGREITVEVKRAK